MRQDLNLLMLSALEALYLTRKTTLAAEKMGVAQPSMSVYLKQLRKITGDELFIRTSHGLEPTDFCHQYYREAKEIISALERLDARKNKTFDPQTMASAFSVAVPFVKGRMLFKELSVRLVTKYPLLNVDMINLPEKEALHHIDDGLADVYLGLVSEKLGKHFIARKILRTELVVICSKISPYFMKGHLSKSEYLNTPHIKASASFEPSILDVKFKREGLLQKRLVAVPDIWAEIEMLKETDYLLVMDKSDVDFLDDRQNFKILKTEFVFPQFDFYAVWHARKNKDPALEWYRNYIFKVCGI